MRLRTADDRTIEGAALIGADGLRSTIRQQMLDEGEPRTIGYVAHRTIVPMAGRDGRRLSRRRGAVVGAGLPHRPLSAAQRARCSTSSRCSGPRPMLERGDIASYRADLDRTYRDSHPSMRALLAMMDLVAALGDLRPRSDPALEQGPRDAARRRRASDAADAGAGRLHGDRGRGLPRRDDRVSPAATSPGVPPLRERALSAHRAGAVRVALSLGQFLSRRRHRARSRARRSGQGRSEDEMFDCLAWLYDGFALPEPQEKAA